MADRTAANTPKNRTPPKGRPTRARNDTGARQRVFGPTVQWTMVAVTIVLAVVILIIVTDGGDFNPFNDEPQAPAQIGAAAQVVDA